MKVALSILLILLSFHSFSQSGKKKSEKVPSFFGFQYKAIFPARFIGEPELFLEKDGFESITKQKRGYSIGGTVRAGVTKLIAIETGINITQRNFNIDFSLADSNIFNTSTLSFIEYDIPINGLIYIQLSEKWYSNASLGVAVTFKPTDVGTSFFAEDNWFYHTGVAQNKLGFDLNANFGFEFRTEKSGFFYLGGSGRVPFQPLFGMIAQHQYQGLNNLIIGDVDGSYLSLDLKYFFPNIANKGTQFQVGPIRQ